MNKQAVTLNKHQHAAYANVLSAFQASVERSYGEATDDVLDALSAVEKLTGKFAQQNGLEYTPELPVTFNSQSFSIEDYLNMLIARRVEIVQSANNDNELREKMIEAGACFVSTGMAFIKPDSKKKIQTGRGTGATFNQFDERFTPVVETLVGSTINGNEIAFSDMTILEGEVSDKTMRNQPFNVIQIPKIGMEVAVCNLYGQSLLISDTLHDPKFYEAFTRNDLKALGLKQVNVSQGWENRLLDKMAADWPQQSQTIDMPTHAKDMATRKKMNLSPRIVGLAMLKYAADTQGGNGEFPFMTSQKKPPGHETESWRTFLSSAGAQGQRGMPKGMTGAAFKIYFGWDDEGKVADDIAALRADNRFTPTPVISVDQAIEKNKKIDLSPEIVGLAMLQYAADTQGGNGAFPTQTTQTTPPGHETERWSTFLTMAGAQGIRGMPKGMTGTAIKLYFDWDDEGKLAEDIAALRVDNSFTPTPIMSVAEAIEKNKGLNDKPNLSPEIIGLAMLKYAANIQGGNGAFPTQTTQTTPPGHETESWSMFLNNSSARGIRGMPKGMTGAAIKLYFGWDDEGKVAEDIAALRADNRFTPTPVISVAEAIEKNKKIDLSPEIIGLAMLQYAADIQGGNGAFPTQTIKTTPPGHETESWQTFLSTAGTKGNRGMPKDMTGAAIKLYFGWNDDAKLADDIAALRHDETFTPEHVMGVEDAIMQNKATNPNIKNNQPEPPEPDDLSL